MVWTYCNGKRRTLDWAAENVSLSEWEMSFRRSEGHDGRQFIILLHFSSLDLEYTLNYQDSIVNKLQLMNNNAPGEGAVENEAVLTFSDIRDEQGYPYLRCNFATNEHDPDGDMVNIEFVAKRTDTEGIRQLGLTKNEKLRLGYAVWDDGTFEPEDSDDELIGQNPESLNRQLQRHIEASVKIHAKLVTMRNNVDKHVMNATNGMQQAMAQAFRSVSNPATSMQPAPSFERTASPPIARRRKNGIEDTAEATPPPPNEGKPDQKAHLYQWNKKEQHLDQGQGHDRDHGLVVVDGAGRGRSPRARGKNEKVCENPRDFCGCESEEEMG